MNESWKWAAGMVVAILAFLAVAWGSFYMDSQTTGLGWFWGSFGSFMLLSAGASFLLLLYFVAKALLSEER